MIHIYDHYSLQKKRPYWVQIEFSGPTSEHQADDFLNWLEHFFIKYPEPIGILLVTDGKNPFPKTQRCLLAKWYRHNKKRLKKHCLGLARVVPKQSFLNSMAATALNLAMPFPFKITHELNEAKVWLDRTLVGLR